MYNTHERIRRGYKNIVKCGGGQRTKDNGQRTMDNGQRTKDKEQRTEDKSKK